MSEKIQANHDLTICHKCMKLPYTHELRIRGRGWGSQFDTDDLTIHLCDDCIRKEYIEWVNEKPVREREKLIYDGEEYTSSDYIERYKHEDELQGLIDSFCIAAQEQIYNSIRPEYHRIYMPAEEYIELLLSRDSGEW